MDFLAYNEILITNKKRKNEVVAGETIGYTFEIRYPSYRGCFLSCIEDLKFEVDGKEIEKNQVSFGLNGKEFTLDEIPDLFREYWYVMTSATIRVLLPGGLKKGGHTLRVYMKHRVPYTGYFGQYLTLESDVTENMELD